MPKTNSAALSAATAPKKGKRVKLNEDMIRKRDPDRNRNTVRIRMLGILHKAACLARYSKTAGIPLRMKLVAEIGEPAHTRTYSYINAPSGELEQTLKRAACAPRNGCDVVLTPRLASQLSVDQESVPLRKTRPLYTATVDAAAQRTPYVDFIPQENVVTTPPPTAKRARARAEDRDYDDAHSASSSDSESSTDSYQSESTEATRDAELDASLHIDIDEMLALAERDVRAAERAGKDAFDDTTFNL